VVVIWPVVGEPSIDIVDYVMTIIHDRFLSETATSGESIIWVGAGNIITERYADDIFLIGAGLVHGEESIQLWLSALYA
jgi:hypothetical protein